MNKSSSDRSRTETLVIERSLEILRILSRKHEITVDDIFRHFEGKVSKRTLQRDLERLSRANIPLQERWVEGHTRVWFTDRSFKEFYPQLLHNNEIIAAYLLGELSKVVKGTPLAEGVEKIRERLTDFLPSGLIASTNTKTLPNDAFFLHQNGYVDLKPFNNQINAFLDALINQKRLQVKYRQPWKNEPVIQQIEPYGILFHAETIYAVARSLEHNLFITMLFHRMESVKVLPNKFARDPEFKMESMLKGKLGIFGQPDQKPVDVVIKFYPPVSQTIKERIWHESQTIEIKKDKTILLKMKVIVSEELVAWILRWQGFAEVITPNTLRELVRNAGFEITQRYQTSELSKRIL